MTTITRDEWLAEFERVLKSHALGDEGLSVAEISASTGVSCKTVCLRLNKIRHRLIVGSKFALRLDGRPTYIPCYQIKPEA